MPFSIAYNITAVDRFTKVSKKVVKSADELEKRFSKFNNAASCTVKTNDKIVKSSNRLTKAKKESKRAFIAAERAAKANKAAGEKLNKTQAKLVTSTDRLNKRKEKLAYTERNLERRSREANIKSQIKELRIQKQLNKAKDRAARQRTEGMARAGGRIAGVGRTLTSRVGLPMAAAGGLSMKMAMDFNKSMASVASLLKEPNQKIGEMKKGVQSLAIETGQSTEELAGGLYQVVSALGESEDNMAQLALASKAAKAGVSSAADAIGMLSAVGKGYNDVSAEALSKTADLAFQTVKLGVTTFPELASSMGNVVPLAAAMKTSQEELFGTMATLTGVTGTTSEVTTQLASVYGSFMKPSEAMQNAVKKINKQNKDYNFSSASAMMKALGFRKSLELLNKTADGNQDKLAKMFTRKEALLAVLPLVSSQSENYNKKLKAMAKVSGAMDDAFREQTEGINKQGHKWEQTKQRMVVFAQRAGDMLLPTLERLLDKLEPVFKWIEGIDQETIDAAVAFGTFAIKAGLLLTVVGKIVGHLAAFQAFMASAAGAGTAAKAISGLAGGMKALAGYLGAVALGYIAAKEAWSAWENKGQKKTEKRMVEYGDLDSAFRQRERMGKESIQKLIQRERQLRASLPKSDMEASFESPDKLFQTFHSNFSDEVVRPMHEVNAKWVASTRRERSLQKQLEQIRQGELKAMNLPESFAPPDSFFNPQQVETKNILEVQVSAAEGSEVKSVKKDGKMMDVPTGKQTL